MSDQDVPFSWLSLTKGMPVRTSEGDEVGKISDVVADKQKDIFSGIAFKAGLLSKSHFVPADLIADMSPSGIDLKVSQAEAEKLEEYEG